MSAMDLARRICILVESVGQRVPSSRTAHQTPMVPTRKSDTRQVIKDLSYFHPLVSRLP